MRNFFALALAVVLLLSALVMPAQAVRYNGSAQYEAGKYYARLSVVKLTGDQRTDIINIATSQLGYEEGNSSSQLSGESKGSGNYTEYGRWYGNQNMWCAMFVSWCANLAGVSKSVIPAHSYTPNGLQHFRDRDLDHTPAQIRKGEYTPRAGDLIYFKNGHNSNRTNHVGLVTGYENGKIYTIEGNLGAGSSDGMVAERSYAITDRTIVAVCSPAYPVAGTSVAEPELDALRDAVYALESGSCYDSVSDACGVLTLGAGQWYGEEARTLLQNIQDVDGDSFAELDTAGIAEHLTPEGWSDFHPTAEQAACIGEILRSDSGVRCQDSRMELLLEDCLILAEELGVTDSEAAVLCAGALHLNGEAAVQSMLSAMEGEITVEALTAADPICRALSRYL